jgi:hypothetical protein
MGVRRIARQLNVSINTVRSIIEQQGQIPKTVRKDKVEIDPDLLTQLYNECRGRIQRVHEILTEQHGICIAYCTLTKIIREQGLAKASKVRCHRVADEPGAEMQHDTTVYQVRLADRSTRVVASLLYYRYSKIRYLKFYPSFNRFAMKCFFHEALSFWEYAAPICIIDNTNLARLHGTGKNAVIVPEMEQFARQYGFCFVCHKIGHANRKAGNERGFYTVETNFLPGRRFDSIEDINRQAFEWSTFRMANRPTGKTRLIPSSAFEQEKPYLVKLPPYVEPPYEDHQRKTDQYGYISFAGNFYWVPGTRRHDVKVLHYSDHISIYHCRQLMGKYPLPAAGVKNEMIYPEGVARPPQKPWYRQKPTAKEEQIMRKADEAINEYLNFALAPAGKQKHGFIRSLYGLYRKIALPVFIKTLKRALKYRIADIGTVERIAVLQLQNSDIQMPMPAVDEHFQLRQAYIDGCFADEIDLDIYDPLTGKNDNDG